MRMGWRSKMIPDSDELLKPATSLLLPGVEPSVMIPSLPSHTEDLTAAAIMSVILRFK